MKIRNGRREDRPAIERIARASFDRVYAFFAIRGAHRARLLLIAEDDGSVAGFLEGMLFDGDPPIGYVYFVAVDPSIRERGIGRSLVGKALEHFHERRATRVFAAVPRDNESSMGLFGSLAFQEVPRGALWRWYRGRSLGVWMRMMIAPHEALLMRTFTDPSPASAQASPGPSS